MVHLPQIIQDLALILVAAGIVTILFRKTRQPLVLGYIMAGLIVGPHVPLLPTISDVPNIRVWGDIGVIFLLFALGLEFSFKKLVKVGGAASLTAVIEVAVMIGLGVLAGKILNWNQMDSLFLGGILAISSTTIIIRAFEELGVKGRGFVHLVFGVLIVEDLVAIVLLALLSTIAITHQLAGTELAASIFKLLFFLAIWFLAGIFLLPTIIKKFRSYANDETALVVSLGLCFLMVVAAVNVGFSPALGAFIMGSILAETTEAERIEHLIKPVKDLFAAVFFVSVGMLIDPKLLMQYSTQILFISMITIAGKIVSTTVGALLSGQNLRQSVQAGFSLAQIGEFSFIIAGLGQSLNVTSEFLYPIAVSVSVITTFVTPYLIRSSDQVYMRIERFLPNSWAENLVKYSASVQSVAGTSEWRALVREYLLKMGVNGVIIIAIFLGFSHYLIPILLMYTDEPRLVHGIGLLLALLVSAPFFWSLIFSQFAGQKVQTLWPNRRKRISIIALESSRVGVAIILFGLLAPRFVTFKFAFGLTLGLLAVTLLLFSRYLRIAYSWFEKHFIENLSARERMAQSQLPPIAPWDAHIVRLEVPAESSLVGKTLEESRIRERFGVTIALIERGRMVLTAPARKEMLFPYDRIAIIGTDEQIENFEAALKPSGMGGSLDERPETANYKLHQIRMTAESPYCFKTIRESGIREKTHGLVVGIERHGRRILNPDSMTRLEPEDTLWVVGDKSLMQDF